MESKEFLAELRSFHKQLKSYDRYIDKEMQLTENQKRYKESLREKLLRKSSALKGEIRALTGRQYVHSANIRFDIWSEAFLQSRSRYSRDALKFCIDAVNEAIGKINPDISMVIKNKQGTSDSTEHPIESPLKIFDAMQLHPKVIEASKSCFDAGNYREAILNAFISLIDYVKELTRLDLDGDDLMNQVFSLDYDKKQRKITKYPIIRINELKNKSDRDEQQGFMFLCKGAAGGIRNPKAHKLIPQSNPLHTLEYLAFASLLMRRIEEGKIDKETSIDHQTI